MTKPVAPEHHNPPDVCKTDRPGQSVPLRTPTSARSLEVFQQHLEDGADSLRGTSNAPLEKAVKALRVAFVDRALLREEVRGLLEQNCEKRNRKSLKRIVVGRGKIMSYEDIFAAREHSSGERSR